MEEVTGLRFFVWFFFWFLQPVNIKGLDQGKETELRMKLANFQRESTAVDL